jgi:predicted O-methyltransferase YrrM
MINNKHNEINTGQYSFTDKNIFAQSLIHLINLYLPKNFIGVEIGTGFGTTACMIAQHCPNIQKLYTIDPYVPYTTSWIGEGIPFGEKEIDNAKILAKHNIQFSGFKEKIELVELESKHALSMFDNESIDLLFYDSAQTIEIAYEDLSNWYKKIKIGGIISGHCWKFLQDAILKFKNEIDSDSILSIHDDVWTWIKK